MAGPLKQFEIVPLVHLGEIGGYEIALTNSALFMLLTVGLASGFMLLGARSRALVPGRWQAAAEMTYDFVLKTLRDNTGEHGLRFFPLVFSLFMFILVANLLGMIPGAFTVTSHLIVTFALAMIVFLTVLLYGLFQHGFGFLRLFLPPGVPLALAPFLIPIEIISFLSRPISHSVRLFAVMLAGHVMLKVFAGFVVSLSAAGGLGLFLAVPALVMTVLITILEFMMALIQAYVFTMLTCMYLNDALHPSH
ncbi:F0F1 ATP synthase subunit A [Hyphomicrobium sp.]|uniref:F0F1 ATP synthase subunit A n=1 Tax=Hyphomicrobium sp. TaxID=82 RepID=UPI002C7C4BB8|nr:F0F1 ATP synthase subunit A [Hyphomicrobium sp.]HRN88861.1 F0F1 ATP synthase subunit A [Hyphomicrobium sp.]HRQ27398.1 F0F1 ATP synthase subunit A [Hyphomicrobium sp.]